MENKVDIETTGTTEVTSFVNLTDYALVQEIANNYQELTGEVASILDEHSYNDFVSGGIRYIVMNFMLTSKLCLALEQNVLEPMTIWDRQFGIFDLTDEKGNIGIFFVAQYRGFDLKVIVKDSDRQKLTTPRQVAEWLVRVESEINEEELRQREKRENG